jgi:hypothetical protein
MKLTEQKLRSIIQEEIKSLNEGAKTTDGLKDDGIVVYNSYASGDNYIDVTEGPIRTHDDLENALDKDKAFQKLDKRQQRIANKAIRWVLTSRQRMER